MAQAWLHGDAATLLVKIETTYGTDVTPGLTDAIEATAWSVKKVVDMKPKSRIGPSNTSRGKAAGQAWAEFSFTCPLVGMPDPDAGEPAISALLQASGFARTDVGAAPVTGHSYVPDTLAAQTSVTIYAYLFQDGGATELWIITGAVCDWKINTSAEEPSTATFTGMGKYNANTNPGAISAPTFVDPTDALIVGGATVTIGARDDCWSAMEFSGNYSIEKRTKATGTNGVSGFIRKRAADSGASGSYDPEMVLTSTYDRWADILAETTLALSATLDTVGGSRIVITAPAFQPLSPDLNPQEKVVTYSQPFDLVQSVDAGDDEITIVFSRTP